MSTTMKAASDLVLRARREALEEARDRVMSVLADLTDVKREAQDGFRAGHATMRYAARDLLTAMVQENT